MTVFAPGNRFSVPQAMHSTEHSKTGWISKTETSLFREISAMDKMTEEASSLLDEEDIESLNMQNYHLRKLVAEQQYKIEGLEWKVWDLNWHLKEAESRRKEWEDHLNEYRAITGLALDELELTKINIEQGAISSAELFEAFRSAFKEVQRISSEESILSRATIGDKEGQNIILRGKNLDQEETIETLHSNLEKERHLRHTATGKLMKARDIIYECPQLIEKYRKMIADPILDKTSCRYCLHFGKKDTHHTLEYHYRWHQYKNSHGFAWDQRALDEGRYEDALRAHYTFLEKIAAKADFGEPQIRTYTYDKNVRMLLHSLEPSKSHKSLEAEKKHLASMKGKDLRPTPRTPTHPEHVLSPGKLAEKVCFEKWTTKLDLPQVKRPRSPVT
jgi:hypothetical protein